MELWDKAERLWTRVKNWKTVRGWHIWKLKLVDARLYFVSMFVGLLTGLVAVPYHYLLYYLFHLRSGFFASHPAWYWHIPLFLFSWGILVFVMWLATPASKVVMAVLGASKRSMDSITMSEEASGAAKAAASPAPAPAASNCFCSPFRI